MLLREINRDKQPDVSLNQEQLESSINSPVKPLNFPKPDMDLNKDANSSSDTYISDNDVKTDRTPYQKKYDEFSFETPKTSTVNLLINENKQETTNDQITKEVPTNYSNSSPNKSAMKKSASFSPKKVAFNQSNPEIHTYTPDNNDQDEASSPVHDDFQRNFESSWNDVSSNDSTPPLPPSHTISTFETLLNENSSNNYNTESSVLTDVKLKHNNFSNLSLNEKLDLYLGNNSQEALATLPSGQSLDQHLNSLQYAEKSNATTNINNLSAALNNPKSLDYNHYLKHEFELKRQSSGSSQSSLQSLRDDNRTLRSINTPIISEPIQLKDGIKGFPDELADEIIPSTHTNVSNIQKSPEYNDSFDKSYMSQSNSIMNLLNSASNLDIPQIKQEDDVPLHSLDPTIKQEVHDNNLIRTVSVKSETDENVYMAAENAQVTSVSDYGRSSSSLKIVMTEFPKVEDDLAETPKIFSNPKLSQDESYESNNNNDDDLTKESIRFHMDSDWKLEYSNDGDQEDNDEYTNDVTAASQAPTSRRMYKLQDTKSVDSSINGSAEFKDASEDLSSKLYLPNPNVSVDENEHDNALANSSNVAPPQELTLPPIEANNYSSFDEVTKNINNSADSYEELLSAEHDEEPAKPENFLSIWHLHERQKKHVNPRADEFFRVIDREEVNDVSQAKIPIPASLKLKKFTEVNVVSRRIVSPDFEDFQVSQFLPELSEDSGLEGHFKFIEKNNTFNPDESSASNTTLNTKDILTEARRSQFIVAQKPIPSIAETSTDNTSRSLNPHNMMTPRSLKFAKQREPSTKVIKSKFKVPSFEIKRTDSMLSPARDMYNDIFEDTVRKPTIIGHGMKTLPSMDHEDVKRILSAKRVISQDEYSKFKLGEHQKSSVVNLPGDYNEQHASICESEDDEEIDHVAHQLMQAPQALVSKDQFFHDYDLFNKQDGQPNNSQVSSRVNSVVHKKSPSVLPDPDVEFTNDHKFTGTFTKSQLANSPMYAEYPISPPTNVNYPIGDDIYASNIEIEKKVESPIFKTPPQQIDSGVNDEVSSRATNPERVIQKLDNPLQSPKRKPIKIGSPLKLVKTGGSTISLQSPKKQPSEFGGELVNHKIRDSPRKPQENASEHIPSTVSVPTVMTASTLSKNNIADSPHAYRAEEPKEEPKLMDKGRLFFRVVGFKNIGLKDFKERNPEFTITLDNGVHSIKTPPYKMSSYNVMIGKEFELTVNDSLEFILTMKMRYEKPGGTLKEVRERKVIKSTNRLSRMIGQKEIVTTTKFVPVDVEDPWENKFAEDGSFARCYIDLDQFEDKVTGKIGTFSINCFNEWETVNGPNNDKIKGKPFVIGQMEVKMLFVPRTDTFEVLPSSMRAGYESIQELKQEMNVFNEGYMHQEGGDCEIWKRRFFKLNGTSLIAHSEFSHKTRAKINLSKVVDVIYVDKENVNNPTNYRNFSDVILLEHAFKIKFADGEVIDFGAPNNYEKVHWIKLFEGIVARNKFRRQPWVKMMLK